MTGLNEGARLPGGPFRRIAGWILLAGVSSAQVVAYVEATDIASRRWWLADPAVVRQAALDGANPKAVFEFPESESPIVASIAADPAHGRLFLGVEQAGPDFDASEIARVGMDGRGYRRLYRASAGTRVVVAYDPGEDRVYFVEGAAPALVVRRMEADGSHMATLLTLAVEEVHDLEVDAVHRRLYWSQDENGTHAGSIECANLDGSGRQRLYTDLGTNALAGFGLDVAHGDLYWVRSDDMLQRGALDGKRKPETVLIGAAVGRSPTGLGVQAASGQILWISAGDLTVRRALLSGADARVVFRATAPTALAVENSDVPRAGPLSTLGVTAMSARLSAEVAAEGDAPLSARGVVLAPPGAAPPAIGAAGVVVLNAPGGLGSFSVEAAGLVPGAAYAARAFATNVFGTGYGPVETFRTRPR